ncbi:MAG: LysM domain surface protein [Candidatus Woesebacteria bacterium GW2011_GWA1_41_13b]|uniref:LysM domain surface protein n=1 Tax=Candidatus Woesebacteria bacterium GW2011_GWA1_41_13b TaxID=1618555 RepID=A0A0G0UR56_9BACT|nr:MAG: LysM domain surface protein [Candidatus Woesebacteria bacterium GW2011_GWA1_41_13b]
MAKSTVKQLRKSLTKIKWQESYASFILGAIIVIVLGLLVANYFSRRGQQIDTGEQTTQSEEQAMAQAQQEYKVLAGDSLSKISEKYYGSMDLWPVLASENNIANPNIIFVDATLKIPAKTDAENTREEMSVTSYQVTEGETFFTIAQKVYGDGSRWTALHQANGGKRLANGNPLVMTGTTIVVPR